MNVTGDKYITPLIGTSIAVANGSAWALQEVASVFAIILSAVSILWVLFQLFRGIDEWKEKKRQRAVSKLRRRSTDLVSAGVPLDD